MKIFLIRHASPDWDRRNIPYDIRPGPRLTARGEKEAQVLADFLKEQGVVKLYYSPFERTTRTAQIVSARNGIPAIEEPGLAEWRAVDEPELNMRQRMIATFERAVKESSEMGPVGLVSHGGPVASLLLELGINKQELAAYRTRFDTTNPLPPAGAWEVEKNDGEAGWHFHLAFMP